MSHSEEYIFYGGQLKSNIHCGCSSLGALIIQRLKEHGNEVAFIDAVSGRTMTFQQILKCSMSVASRMKHYGLGKASIIGIMSENRLEYSIAAFATIFVGGILIPLNPSYTPTELKHVLNLTKPQTIFTSTRACGTLKSAMSGDSSIKFIVSFDNEVDEPSVKPFGEFLKSDTRESIIPDPVILKNDVAIMVLSSGTTGLPKAVQLTHFNVMTVVAYMREDPRYNELSVPIRLLGLLPFYHVYGFMLMLNVCCNRYSMVVLPRFEPDLLLRSIQDHMVTMANLVPPLVVFLAKHPSVEQYDLSSLQAILCGAAPLSRDIELQVVRRLPHIQNIRIGYGMSEASLGVISKINGKPGTVGRVHKTTWVKVVDTESGKTLGPYQVGEICIKGPLVMKGYYKNEQATRETIDTEGWLHSGDTGYFDDEGDFFIVDRIKDLIKYKGFQVAPAEVEDILLSHPKIRDAAVVGIPDEDSGELPAAFVVLQEGAQLSAVDVQRFVASKLSPQKHLRGGVYFLQEIPKTGSGKILRRELRDRILGKKKSKL
nr:4-coumarate--CoA ligase 1-like [Aedes albopictus]